MLPWKTVGGTELATLRIAQSIEGEEFKNTAFHLSEAIAVKNMFSAEGFETEHFQGIEPSYRRPFPFLRASLALAKEIKRRNINLIHCADLKAGYHASVAGRLAGVPVICHIRCSYPELSRRDKSFLSAVSHFVFVSHDTWDKFAYKVPARRGTIIYDGIDVLSTNRPESKRSVLDEYQIPENAKIVGMIGRVAEAKDYATLARAAARLVAVDKNIRFLIVGDHSGTSTYRKHFEEVKQMLAANAVSQYFIFTDFQSEVMRFLDAMDVFVLSTHGEGLPLVILEAMAQGRPIVATAVGGIPEIVEHEKTGLLYPHKDDEQLSAHILTLLQDKSRAVRLGEAGRRSVKKDWSRERFGENIKKLYREILTGKKKRFAQRIIKNTFDHLRENKF